MQLITRAQWGARPPRYALVHVDSTRGVKVHYEGTHVPTDLAEPAAHVRCAGRMRALQASHLANDREDYADIAYTAVVCPHGAVFEGRGPHRRTAANGNRALNEGHYAVCAMLGDSGLTQPTDAMLAGLRDAIAWLRADGAAGTEILGHRDGYATECPGPALYAWLQKGAPRPAVAAPPPAQRVSLAHLMIAARRDPGRPQGGTTYPGEVRTVERALVAEHLLDRKWVDGSFGTRTRDAYAAWQRHCGYTGPAADGIPGKASLARLGEKHGFKVVD